MNGEKLYTINATDPGYVGVHISRGRKRHEKRSQSSVSATGINWSADGTAEELEWQRRTLTPGDEVTVRLIETDLGDEPQHRSISDPILNERRRREYYNALKAEYGE